MSSPVTLKLINAAYDTAVDIIRNRAKNGWIEDIDGLVAEIESCRFPVNTHRTDVD